MFINLSSIYKYFRFRLHVLFGVYTNSNTISISIFFFLFIRTQALLQNVIVMSSYVMHAYILMKVHFKIKSVFGIVNKCFLNQKLLLQRFYLFIFYILLKIFYIILVSFNVHVILGLPNELNKFPKITSNSVFVCDKRECQFIIT